MPDYELRGQLYDSGFIQEYKKLRWECVYYNIHGYEEAAIDSACKFLDLSSDPVAFDEARRAANSDYHRNARLKNRIRKLLEQGDCVFLTLTFTDIVLSNTSYKTRRLYVTQYLKSQSQSYVANIDFGARNNREHYHAIVCGKANLDRWTYGNIDAKRIIKSSNPLVLAKYINKLVQHSIKETCKRNHIIYSRRVE